MDEAEKRVWTDTRPKIDFKTRYVNDVARIINFQPTGFSSVSGEATLILNSALSNAFPQADVRPRDKAVLQPILNEIHEVMSNKLEQKETGDDPMKKLKTLVDKMFAKVGQPGWGFGKSKYLEPMKTRFWESFNNSYSESFKLIESHRNAQANGAGPAPGLR